MLGMNPFFKKMLGYGTKYRCCPNISSDSISCVVPLDLTHMSI